MDDAGTEHPDGWLLTDGAVISTVGSGPEPPAEKRVDLGGAVVTPGLVNTHHHLYQTLTRARAQQADLFTLAPRALPGLGADRRRGGVRRGPHRARGARALRAARPSSTTTTSSPRGRDGLIEAEVQAARELGVRIVASRGSMDLGVSDGGLPARRAGRGARRRARRDGAARRARCTSRARRARPDRRRARARRSRSPAA